jgi:multidrug resistance efflux pump
MILSLLPDRSLVKQGDVVCELDSADLKDRLIEQIIAARRAETEFEAARLARELAELALKQYTESSYLVEKGAVQGAIKMAESSLVSASDQLEHMTRGYEKGTITKAQKVASELAVQKTKFDLELAQSKLNDLESFGKPMAVKRLSGEVEKTRTQEHAAMEIRELRQSQVERIRRQVANCQIKAPTDGRLVLSPHSPRPELKLTEPEPLRAGDTVRERQELARIIPSNP